MSHTNENSPGAPTPGEQPQKPFKAEDFRFVVDGIGISDFDGDAVKIAVIGTNTGIVIGERSIPYLLKILSLLPSDY